MKIAIMTLRLHKNYGGILQNYALNKTLREMGHDVETINIVWDIRLKQPQKYIIWIKRIIKNIIKFRWTPLDIEGQILKLDPITTQHTKAFKLKNIPLTKKIYYLPNGDFSDINDKFDAVVVGSDQVWRPKYANGIEHNFLDFITNERIKRIAYSISFGTDRNEYTPHQQMLCGKLIKKFKAISVREESSINLIQNIFKWEISNITQTLDPTLLLKKEEYLKLIGNYKNINKIFYYILDYTEDKQKVINQMEHQLGISSYTLTPEGMSNNSTSIIPPVEEWLKSILSSQFVITDSFHGCVFCIIFNKPFIVYGNNFRGKARFDSLLKIFGLENRFIESSSQLKDKQIFKEPIDWETVNNVLEEQKQISKNFLISALS